jgi:mannose-6-phosphate isomerase-like protein (cupin superfamily)
MEYHDINPRDIPETPEHPCTRHAISEATGLAVLSLNKYLLEPGDDLAVEYHYHDQREEAFIVETGTLHVETPKKTFTVESNHIFVVEPKSPIRPYNPETADSTIEVLGIGAPAFDIGRAYDPNNQNHRELQSTRK